MKIGISLVILFATLSLGCENDPTDPSVPSDDFLTGTVRLWWDEHGNTPTELSGTKVGVTSSKGVAYSGTTDDMGIWKIYNVPIGVYTVSASKTEYTDLSTGSAGTATNVQYVGTGGYTAPTLFLAKDISPTMISNASVIINWHYNYHGEKLIDSTAMVTVKFETQNKAEFYYELYVVESQTNDCGQAIANFGSEAIAEGGIVTINLGQTAYRDLKEHYGAVPIGKQLFMNFQPRFSKAPAHGEPSVRQCLPPLSVPIKF